jgi:hypothetical protein
MPTSKKRVKKEHPDQKPPVSRNIVKSKGGKIVLLILALSFVFSGVALLITTLIEAMQ